MWPRRQVERFADGSGDVGISGAGSEVTTGLQVGTAGEQKRMLAGVVGGGRRRVVAMVGGNEEEIAGKERREKFGQRGIPGFEGSRHAARIVTMSVEHIEVFQIGEE